jgi:hypothetical protein
MSEVVRPTMDPVRLLPPFSGCHPSFVIDLNLSIVHCGVRLPTGLLKVRQGCKLASDPVHI